ncbi:MAG TPA: hypothetical protein PK668_15505 [Myxococcota bacterium]|nr:hypothetical protein [Myxococcota bacterium]HRY94301.1 hypothetical protein [Myxococcota bacterium]
MNSRMADQWPRISLCLAEAELQKSLSDLAASSLVDVMGAVVLQELLGTERGDPPADDLTGFEASVNKIHISDYVAQPCHGNELLAQGVKYAETLVSRLTEIGRPFCVFLSRDPDSDEVVAAFHVRRAGAEYLSEDLEGFLLEEIVRWDLGGEPEIAECAQ